MSERRETPEGAVNRFLRDLGRHDTSLAETDASAARLLKHLELEYRKRTPRGGSFPTLTASPSVSRAFALGVLLLAAIVALVVLMPRGEAVAARVEGGEVFVSGGGSSGPIGVGGSLKADEQVHAGEKGSVLSLADGSKVEVRAESAFSISQGKSGIEIFLTKGIVLITAAEQRQGRLMVLTRDCAVSVVGTVFAVRAEESGSRVSVFRGSVRVEQGRASTTLMPGEQIATSPALGLLSLREEISWSLKGAAVAQLVQQPAGVEAEADIEGTVVDALNGTPIGDAVVYLQNVRSGAPKVDRQITTGSDGRFVFERLPAGSYHLAAAKDGFWMPDAEPSQAPTLALAIPTVALPPATALRGLSLRMVASASILGRVLEQDGRPAKSQVLTLWRIRYYENGAKVLVPAAGVGASGGTTNDRGEFEFKDVFPGKYYLRTSKESSRRAYYPGVASVGMATPIVLEPGAALAGVEFILPEVPVYSVRITLPAVPQWNGTRTWTGSTPPGATPRGVPSMPSGAPPSIGLWPNGELKEDENLAERARLISGRLYEIAGVPPGDYRLNLTWSGRWSVREDGAVDELTATATRDLKVVDGNLDLTERDLNFPVSSTMPRIPLRAVASDGVLVPVSVKAVRALSASVMGAAFAVGQTGASGNGGLEGLRDGSYWLGYSTSSDRFISGARYRGQDVLYAPITAEGGDPTALEIVVEGPGATVEGVLQNARGDRISQTRVVLIPSQPRRQNPLLTQTTATDQDGTFSFKGVPPGDYAVYAWEFAPRDAFRDPDWFREFEGQGTPVIAQRGITAKVVVRVISGFHW